MRQRSAASYQSPSPAPLWPTSPSRDFHATASGKRGTGKTTLAVNLARAFGLPVQLVDCDGEEPNAHLFLHGRLASTRTVTLPVPQVDELRCEGCGLCAEHCRYNAIAVPRDVALRFPELCHGCGGCIAACPHGTLSERDERLGVVKVSRAQLRAHVRAVLDAPPGTSCTVVAALRGVDHAVLVTEPTPFGRHDLGLAVELVRTLGVPHGVVVNRAGSGDDRVAAWCHAEGVPVLLELPDDRRIATAYARGELLVEALPEYLEPLAELAQRLLAPAAQVAP